MFHFVEKNQKLVKGIMIVIVATFVFWGIGSYIGMGDDDGYVAKVAGKKIYSQDIDQAIQNNPQLSDKMQVLFNLINRQLLLSNFDHYHMVATKTELQNTIANIPSFQENGKFSISKYQNFLKSKAINVNQFQDNVQNQILVNNILDLFKGAYFTSNLFNEKFANLLSMERHIATYTIKPQQFYASINPTDKEISDYYKQNITKYTDPEQARVQYIQLNANNIAKTIKINDATLEKYIVEHKDELENKQIDALHILFKVPNNATAAAKAQIQKTAAKVLAQIRANPTKFADYATKYSEDTVSAKNGGDLGFFARGIMVKPFENVAFNLKPNQISDLVETNFGYHIIKLKAIKMNNDTEIKAAALTKLQKQQATTLLAKQVEVLNDITYNQPTSLEPAAKKLGLVIENHPNWVAKSITNNNNDSNNNTTANPNNFTNPKIQKAIFNNDVIKAHNNSEVVDLGGSNYAVYHVTEYTPSKVLPLNAVREQIIQNLKAQQAATLVYKTGQDNILKLQQKKLKLDFTNPQNINLLAQNPSISAMAVKQIFATSIKSLPAYTGSLNQAGDFVIYQIDGESINQKLVEQNRQTLSQMGSNNAMLDLSAYVAFLKSKYSVEYKVDRLKTAQGSEIPQ